MVEKRSIVSLSMLNWSGAQTMRSVDYVTPSGQIGSVWNDPNRAVRNLTSDSYVLVCTDGGYYDDEHMYQSHIRILCTSFVYAHVCTDGLYIQVNLHLVYQSADQES